MEQLELDYQGKKEANPFRTLMLSGYLIRRPEDHESQESLKVNMEKFGYDSNNFAGIDTLKSNGGREVRLLTPKDSTVFDLFCYNEIADLGISGSTRPNEMGVKLLSPSGLPIARYSIFYGGESGYSGERPEETGYSLDIPKRIEAVKALLGEDSFLEAILERDASKVRKSLESLNRKIPQPILATPYLERALSIIPQ